MATTPDYDEFRALLTRSAFAEAAALAEKQCLKPGRSRAFWLTQLAHALTRQGKHTRAVEAADEALREDPVNQYALVARADAFLGADEPTKACADYEEVANSTIAGIRNRARIGVLECLGRDKRWDTVLSRVGGWDLEPRTSMRWRTRALAGLGRTDEAVDTCKEWLRQMPDDPHGLWELVHLEVAREGVESVRARIGRLAKIPSKPPIYGEIYASLSRQAGHSDEAIVQYEKLSVGAAAPRMVRQQAFALAKAGREAEAIPLMEELLRLSPSDMYIHTSFVAACKRSGSLERAWRFYHELMALFPDERGLYGRLKNVKKALAAVEAPQAPRVEERRGPAEQGPAGRMRVK
jgi:tetratricopeptide (TPR) repeat protein